MIQHLLQAFLPKQHLMAVWLSRAIIVLYHRFCHIKDVRRKIVIWIIYNNVATETKRLQENMFALENLAYSENLAPPCSSENSSPPLIVKAPLSCWNLAPIAFFRALPPPFTRGEWGGGAFYGENGMNPLGMLPIQQNVCTKGPEGKCFYPM